VTAVITDQASSDNTDFILGKHAFSRMAQTTDAAASLLALGVLDIDFNIDGNIKKLSSSYNPFCINICLFFLLN